MSRKLTTFLSLVLRAQHSVTMLSTPPTRSASDHSFFSSSKISKQGASATSPVHVTTRLTCVPIVQRSSSTTSSQSMPASSSPPSSLNLSLSSGSSDGPKKRKSRPPELSTGLSDLPREVKRLRASPNKQKAPGRKSSSSSKNSSRAASRQNTLPPSPEPIYRSSRSRSTSLFPTSETETPKTTKHRRWFTDEDGTPGESHLSSEMVVKRLMKSYKSCTLIFL